jgi:hypothetical protein
MKYFSIIFISLAALTMAAPTPTPEGLANYSLLSLRQDYGSCGECTNGQMVCYDCCYGDGCAACTYFLEIC